MKLALQLILILLILGPTSRAFDGKRKGVVIGGGVGFAPISRWSVSATNLDVYTDQSESKAGIGAHLFGGYGWNEKNTLVAEANLSSFKSEFFSSYVLYPKNRRIKQGYIGASWFHYFGSVGSSLFTDIGLGYFYFKVDEIKATKTGGGFLFGAGYEFAPHLQAGVYIAGGKTSNDDVKFNHTQINVLISAMAF